jgi:hypothetical protein
MSYYLQALVKLKIDESSGVNNAPVIENSSWKKPLYGVRGRTYEILKI